MLQRPFKEATQAEVEVDEEAQPLLNFCYVVHHQLDKLGEVNRNMLYSLAELADRRGATRTIGFWMGVQLSRAMFLDPAKDCLEDVPNAVRLDMTSQDVLALAYICDEPEVVWKASRMFIVHHKDLVDSKRDPANLPEQWGTADVFGMCVRWERFMPLTHDRLTA